MRIEEIKYEMNLEKIIAESREVAQALNEFADNLEQIEKKYAETQESEKKKTEESKTRNDLLILKMYPGIKLKSDVMEYWRKEILKMKETGVVVLPWFLDVVAVPDDVEVQFIDPKSSCVLEEDQNGI